MLKGLGVDFVTGLLSFGVPQRQLHRSNLVGFKGSCYHPGYPGYPGYTVLCDLVQKSHFSRVLTAVLGLAREIFFFLVPTGR